MIEKLIEEAREQATCDVPESTQVLLLKMADALEKLKPRKTYIGWDGVAYEEK